MRARPIGNDPTGSARTAVNPHCSSTSPTRTTRAFARPTGREARDVGEHPSPAAAPLQRGQDVVLDREPPEGLHPLERPSQAPPRAGATAETFVMSRPGTRR